MIQSGVYEPAMRVLNAVGSVRRKARVYGSDAVCFQPGVEPWTTARRRLGRRFRCTVATLEREGFGADGKAFFDRYSARYRDSDPHPFAIYGYEAMALLLDSIERAAASGGGGGGPYQNPLRRAQSGGEVTRAKVVDALFATRDRRSVLGTYGIDANGDTTLADFGLYRLTRDDVALDRVLRAPPP